MERTSLPYEEDSPPFLPYDVTHIPEFHQESQLVYDNRPRT
jgi:hypothetical protein